MKIEEIRTDGAIVWPSEFYVSVFIDNIGQLWAEAGDDIEESHGSLDCLLIDNDIDYDPKYFRTFKITL